MKRKSRLNGKRAVPMPRCSTMEQADTSIDDQMNSMEYFAEEYDMELADALQLVGKSGSIKANLEAAMDEIIARKRSGERIDVVLFYDQSRFGRSGPLHFGALPIASWTRASRSPRPTRSWRMPTTPPWSA